MSFKWIRMLLQPLNNNLQQLCLRRTAPQSKAISKGLRHARPITTIHNQRKMDILRKNTDLLKQISVMTKLPSCTKLVGDRSEPMLKKWSSSYLRSGPSSRCFLKAHGTEPRRKKQNKLSKKISTIEKFHQASREGRYFSRSLPNIDSCPSHTLLNADDRNRFLTRPVMRRTQTCEFSNWQSPIFPVNFKRKTEDLNPNLQLVKNTIQQAKAEYGYRSKELRENKKAKKITYKGHSTAEPALARNHIWLKKSNKQLDLSASDSYHSLTTPPTSTRTLLTSPHENVRLTGKLASDMKNMVFTPLRNKMVQKRPPFNFKASTTFVTKPIAEDENAKRKSKAASGQIIAINNNSLPIIQKHDDRSIPLGKVPSLNRVASEYIFQNPIKLPPELREKAFVENYLNNLTPAQSCYSFDSVPKTTRSMVPSKKVEKNKDSVTPDWVHAATRPPVYKKRVLSRVLVRGDCPKLIWKEALSEYKTQEKFCEPPDKADKFKSTSQGNVLKQAVPRIDVSKEPDLVTRGGYKEAVYKSFCEIAKLRNLYAYIPQAKPKLKITFPTNTINYSTLEKKCSNWNQAVQSLHALKKSCETKKNKVEIPLSKRKVENSTKCGSRNVELTSGELPQSAPKVPIGLIGMCKNNTDGRAKTKRKEHRGAHSIFLHRNKHRKSKEIKVTHNRKKQSRPNLENLFKAKLKRRRHSSPKIKHGDWVDCKLNLFDMVPSSRNESKINKNPIGQCNEETSNKPKSLVPKAGDTDLPAILKEKNIDILKQKITTPLTPCKYCGLFHSYATQGKCPLMELMRSSDKTDAHPMCKSMFTRTYSTNSKKNIYPTATDELLNVCRYCGLVHANSGDNCPMNQALKLFVANEKKTCKLVHPLVGEQPKLPKKEVMLKRIHTLQDNLKLYRKVKKISTRQQKNSNSKLELQNENTKKTVAKKPSFQMRVRKKDVKGVVKAYDKKKIPNTMKSLKQCQKMNSEDLSKFTKSLGYLIKTLMKVTKPDMQDSAKIVQGKMHFIIEEDPTLKPIDDQSKEMKPAVNPHCRKCAALRDEKRKTAKHTMSKVTYSSTQKADDYKNRYNFEITCKRINSTKDNSTGNRTFNTSCVSCLTPRRVAGRSSLNNSSENKKNFSVSSFKFDKNKKADDSVSTLSIANSENESPSNDRIRPFVSIADSKRLEVLPNSSQNIASLKVKIPEDEIRERRCRTCIETLKYQVGAAGANKKRASAEIDATNNKTPTISSIHKTKSDMIVNQVDDEENFEEIPVVRKNKAMDFEERKRTRSLINLKPSGIEKNPMCSSLSKGIKGNLVDELCEDETKRISSSSKIAISSEPAHRAFPTDSSFFKRKDSIRQRARLSSSQVTKESGEKKSSTPEDCPPPPCPICPSKVDYTCERKLCNSKSNIKNTITEMMKLKNWCEMDLLQARMRKQRQKMEASKKGDKFYEHYQCDTHRAPIDEKVCHTAMEDVSCEEYLCPPDKSVGQNADKCPQTVEPEVCNVAAADNCADSCSVHIEALHYGPLTESDKKFETARCRSAVAKGMVFEIDRWNDESDAKCYGSEKSQSGQNATDACAEDIDLLFSQKSEGIGKSAKLHALSKTCNEDDSEKNLDAECKYLDHEVAHSKKNSIVPYSGQANECNKTTIDFEVQQVDHSPPKTCKETDEETISKNTANTFQSSAMSENSDKVVDMYRKSCAKEVAYFKNDLNYEVKKEADDSIGLKLGRAELEEWSQKRKDNDFFKISPQLPENNEEVSAHIEKSPRSTIRKSHHAKDADTGTIDDSIFSIDLCAKDKIGASLMPTCKDTLSTHSITSNKADATSKMIKGRKKSPIKRVTYYDEEDNLCSKTFGRRDKSLKSSKANEKIFVADQCSGCRNINIDDIKLPTFDDTIMEDEISVKKMQVDDECSISDEFCHLEGTEREPSKVFEADQCSGARKLEPIFYPEHTSSPKKEDVIEPIKAKEVFDAEKCKDDEPAEIKETGYNFYRGLRKNENPVRSRERELEVIKLMELSIKKMKEQELAKQNLDKEPDNLATDDIHDGHQLKGASSATCLKTKMKTEEEGGDGSNKSKHIAEGEEMGGDVKEQYEPYNMMSARPKANKYQFFKPSTEIIVELVPAEDNRPDDWKEAEEELRSKAQSIPMAAPTKQPNVEKSNELQLKHSVHNEDVETGDAKTTTTTTTKVKREVIKKDWETELTKSMLEKDIPFEPKHAPSATSTFRKTRKPKPTKRSQKSVLDDGHTDDIESGKTSYTDTKLMKYDLDNSIFDGQNFYKPKQENTDAAPKMDYAKEIAEKIKPVNDYEEDDFREEMLREEKERRISNKLRGVAELSEAAKSSMHLCYATDNHKVEEEDTKSTVAQIKYYPITTMSRLPRQKYEFTRYDNIEKPSKKFEALQIDNFMDESKRMYYQEEIRKCKKKIQELRSGHDSSAAIQNEVKVAPNILEHKKALGLKTGLEVKAMQLAEKPTRDNKAIVGPSSINLRSNDLITPANKAGVVHVCRHSEANAPKSMKAESTRSTLQKQYTEGISSNLFGPKSSQMEYTALSNNHMDTICTNVLKEIESLKSGKSKIAPITKEKNIQAKKIEFAKKMDTKALVKANPQATTLAKNHMTPKWKYLDQPSNSAHYAQYPNENTNNSGKSGQINKCMQGVKKCLNTYKRRLGDFNLMPKMNSHFEFEPEKTVSTPNLRGRKRSKTSRASTGSSVTRSNSIEMLAAPSKREKCSTQISSVPLLMPGQSTMNSKKRRSSSSVFNQNSRQHHMACMKNKLGFDSTSPIDFSHKVFDDVTVFIPSGKDYVDVEELSRNKIGQKAADVQLDSKYSYTKLVSELEQSPADDYSSIELPSCSSNEETSSKATDYFQHLYDVTTSKIKSLTQKFDGCCHALLSQSDDFWPASHYSHVAPNSSVSFKKKSHGRNDSVDKDLGLLTAKLKKRRMEQKNQLASNPAKCSKQEYCMSRQAMLNDIFKDVNKGGNQSKAKYSDVLYGQRMK